jgi:hypothetical protein
MSSAVVEAKAGGPSLIEPASVGKRDRRLQGQSGQPNGRRWLGGSLNGYLSCHSGPTSLRASYRTPEPRQWQGLSRRTTAVLQQNSSNLWSSESIRAMPADSEKSS